MTDDELKALFKELAGAIEDSRRYIDIFAEGLRHEIRVVAEKVTGLDEKLTREAADIRGEMRQGFADMHAMMKFSHGEVDRREVLLFDLN